jgi:hypothetical protein
MLNELGSERSFNIIDDILVEAAMKNAETEDILLKIRTAFDKIYTASDNDDPAVEVDYSDVDYLDQSEDGYLGLPFAPLN